MIVGFAAGIGCFVGLGCLLCILWRLACGLGCKENTAKVMPMDFRSNNAGSKKKEKEDSTSSRRQLNEGASADFRD